MITMLFERLRDLREDKNITQEKVAEKIHVKRSTYSGYEIVRDQIPLPRLNLLAEFYEVSFDYITGITDIKSNYKKVNIDAAIIGKNLKNFRKKKHIKATEICQKLNINSSTYSAYETGKVIIQTDFLYTIAKDYEYSLDKFLDKDN